MLSIPSRNNFRLSDERKQSLDSSSTIKDRFKNLRLASRKDDVQDCVAKFDEIVKAQDPLTPLHFNLVLKAYRQSRDVPGLLQFYDRMKSSGIPCDSMTYTQVLDLLLEKNHSSKEIYLIFCEAMKNEAVFPLGTYQSLYNRFVKDQNTKKINAVRYEMDSFGIQPFKPHVLRVQQRREHST